MHFFKLREQLINWVNLDEQMEINNTSINYEWNNLINITRNNGSIKKVIMLVFQKIFWGYQKAPLIKVI
ncbi:hypothetical protein ULMS_05050 [Patiriisocius marinistellae]|uniref:Uncharacterized protein n=1 Tax=Patiriisocius marinistellae TaxID=2494560 RepID=A0A5J4FSG7_9FLAO|nr:hypothetical protein ULMS_05050 [Patiriisocius marinistellae]